MKLPTPDAQYGHSREQVEWICQQHNIPMEKFWDEFGVNTAALDDKGQVNYYGCDIERTLARILRYRKVTIEEMD